MYISLQSTLVAGGVKWPAFAELASQLGYPGTDINLKQAVQFAVAIGCPRMSTWVMSSSETPKEELRKIYKARFEACANILARSHARLGLEFLGPLHIRKQFPHEFIWRMDEMLQFAR